MAVGELEGEILASESARVRATVKVARERQAERLKGSGARLNAHMSGMEAAEFARADAERRKLLARAIERLGLTPRGYCRVLKVRPASPTSTRRTLAQRRRSPRPCPIASGTEGEGGLSSEAGKLPSDALFRL